MSVYSTRGAGFSAVGRDKRAPEDRWALAELDGCVVGAVADGISHPSGSARADVGSASAAVADEAVGAFVERASRLVDGGACDAEAIVRDAFAAAELAARTWASSLRGAAGGAAFVGACLDRGGTLAVVKVGDCRAFVPVGGGWRPLTPSDDADREGALTTFLGAVETQAEVVVHRRIDRALLMSDGGWRAGLPAPSGLPAAPFALVRDLVARARRAGETDDLTALVLERSTEDGVAGAKVADRVDARSGGVLDRLAPMTFVLGGVLFFAAGLVAATLFGGAP